MIIRTAPRESFAIIRNAVLEDPRLSFKAKGVIAYLLSRPPNWKANAEHLRKVSKDGRDAVLSAMKELRVCGYAKLVSKRSKKTGMMKGKEWHISDITENRETRKSKQPKLGKADTNKTKKNKTEKNKSNKS